MHPIISELVGTFVLLAFGLSVNANAILKQTKGLGAGWVLISFGWGLAVFCGVTVAGPYSGAHINPAVTLGLAVAGLFPWTNVLPFILAQMAGAALGAIVVWLNFKDHFAAEEKPETKLGVFSTGPQIANGPINFFNEVTGTFLLMFVILYFTGPQVEGVDIKDLKVGLGSIGALPVALLVTVIGMGFGGTTGYAINPARDLSPRIMHAILPIPGKGPSNWKYAWIPVIAPLTGAAIASILYLVIS